MSTPKVYTRRGDGGQTDLVGGVRVSKTHPRLEAYGAIDELSSHIGLLASLLQDNYPEREWLRRVQNNLFRIGTYLATDQTQTQLHPAANLPENETERLEQHIDALQDGLPVLRGFILPGGTTAAAQCHVARTVCRRAERCITALGETVSVDEGLSRYINRLSDYLFVLAKKVNFNSGVSEILWQNVCV